MRYRIHELLGEGGTAEVYRAYDELEHREVALKIMKDDPRDKDAKTVFFRQVEVTRTLTDADIGGVVRVRNHGYLEEEQFAGRPFIALDLYPATLAQCLRRYEGRPQAAARLVRDLATTLAGVHALNVSHGDLKPSNVLMQSADGFGKPYLTDFGAAQRLERTPGSSETLGLFVCPPYTAPEVLAQVDHARDTADVYSLGTVLYELLVGHLPYDGPLTELMRAVKSAAAVRSPRSRGIAIHRHLELICLCSLEKNPRLRYRTAKKLAADLSAYLEGRVPWIASLSMVARSWRQCLRHPGTALLGASATVLLLSSIAIGLWTTRTLESGLREQTSRANSYAAQMAAGQILHLHRAFGDTLRPCARHAAVVQHLAELGGRAPDAVSRALTDCAPRTVFDSIVLLDVEGCPLARVPEPDPSYFQRCFDFRDYFAGARRLAERRLAWYAAPPEARGPEPEDLYIARAHRSEGDQQFKFSVSMPVFDVPRGDAPSRWVGLLMATLGTDSTIASFPLSDRNDPERIGVLVSLRDREREEASVALPREFRVVIHQGLAHGDTVPISSPELEGLRRHMESEDPDQRYQFKLSSAGNVASSTRQADPVRGFEGDWLAGMARVGQTEQVVIVQTRYRALNVVKEYLWHFALTAALLLALAYAVALALVPALRRGAQ